jgi:hypothetical protein
VTRTAQLSLSATVAEFVAAARPEDVPDEV